MDADQSPIATITDQGVVDSRTKYDAWGEIVAQQGISGAVVHPNTDGPNADLPATDNQPIGFTGYFKDRESGLYYAKARYYDPRTARFTSEDPAAGMPMNPPSLHKYLYAYANPTVYRDPDGKRGIFFDGTWNDDRPETIAAGHQTNIYRLQEAYNGPSDYEPGVGTEWYTKPLGGGLGLGAWNRVNSAYEKTVKFFNSSASQELRVNHPDEWERVRQLDVFGFSRGAAEARQFANILRERGIPDQRQPYNVRVRDSTTGVLKTEKRFRNFEDVNIRFLGLFDTVPAMGNPFGGVNLGWDFSVDPTFVGQTRHAVAADEFRSAFDLYSIKSTSSATLPPNQQERWYPGSHSDQGGGSAPGEEGRSNALARLSLNWIYDEAKKAGATFKDLPIEDTVLPDITDASDDFLRRNLIHDSREGITGFADKLLDRQSRTVYYSSSGKETLSHDEMTRRWKQQNESKPFTVKESGSGSTLLEPTDGVP